MSRICQVCSTDNLVDAIYCDNCGTPLSHSPPGNWPQQNSRTVVEDLSPVAAPAAAIFVPRLVIKTSGAVLNIPKMDREMIIGRQDPTTGSSPDIDLVPHGGRAGGVSRQHAKLTLSNNQCFIQDLHSANFTFINGQKIIPGKDQLLNNGDEIRLGGVEMKYYTN